MSHLLPAYTTVSFRMSRSVRERALIFLLAIGTFLGTRPCQAQDAAPLPENRYTTHATLFGAGRTSLYETYLSPSTYTGPHLSILHETLRKTHWLDGRITTQSILDGFFLLYLQPGRKLRRTGGQDKLFHRLALQLGRRRTVAIDGRRRSPCRTGGDLQQP